MKKRQKIRSSIIAISFFLFPATYFYFSPYMVIEGTLNRVICGSFIFFLFLFVQALFLGRAFCGWVCPAGGGQDIITGIHSTKITKGKWLKWLIWIPWIATIVALAIKNNGYEKIVPFYQTTNGLSIDEAHDLIVYLIVLGLILVPAFIFGRRAFCHTICWIAPFMIIGRKIRNLLHLPALQLKSTSVKCTNCSLCTQKCPMS